MGRTITDDLLEARAKALVARGGYQDKIGKPHGPNLVIHRDGWPRRIRK